ncbi:MAG: flagellar motor protein MotB [Sphingomonas sp.]|uniref:OmpA family protein n=1 Tax=Sphingomonas sp. TaxID=28214 RepID=UPI001B108A64|nr:OmpA family protein [Sphingomonas sp.]MBO9622017.1 flagellar motor protein MotB [Sphingomonas sp.]
MNPADILDAPARPLWLTTLADLALLLVGFFVFLQASQVDPGTLAASFRAGFGVKPVPAEMPVAAAEVRFTAGSAAITDASTALAWARSVARDPRTRLVVQGQAEGGGDVEAATGSAAILAADRARAVAALLVRTGAVAPGRIQISTGRGHTRALLTIGFDGGRQ